jgi:hypothetical protein
MDTINFGDNNEQVKIIQKYLKIKVDGIFGNQTKNAVKNYQIENGFEPNGIVDSKIWNHMGILTTDISENLDNLKELEIIPSHLPLTEYFFGTKKKEWVFLHHTAGNNNPFSTIINWGKDNRGKIATEFVIGGQNINNVDIKHDGIVVQAFPEGSFAWHLGIGNTDMHKNSVGIELNNFGYLNKGGYFTNDNKWIHKESNKFYNYVGMEVNPEQIVELDETFRNHKFYHKYSNEQIEKLRLLLLFIANRDSIDIRNGLPKLISKKGAFKAFEMCDVNYCERNKGLWSHTNVMKTKSDIFPQKEMVDMLLSL